MRIPFLTAVNIEPTNDCNKDCAFCDRKQRPIGYMDYSFFKDIVNQLPHPRILRVGLSFGGESALHQYLPDMIRYCHSKHFRDLNIYSNGTMTYPEGVRLVCLPKPPPYVFSADFKITKTYMPLPPKTWFTYCHHLYNYLAVLWNGDVTTCCHDIAGKNILGNLKEESLSEVWHGNKIEALRKRGFCIGCELWQYGYFKTGKSIISLER